MAGKRSKTPQLANMTVEMRDIEKVIPYPGNPRKNTTAVKAVATSLKEYGFRQPIVVDPKGVVVVGHTRLLAAQRLKMEQVPVHVATDLSEEQLRAYRIADNATGDISEWDGDLLGLELRELKEADYDLSLIGFDDEELARWTGEQQEGLTDPDEVPPAPPEPITKPGDLWVMGNHRLLCGDSTKAEDVARLMGGERAGLVFTSPPYASQRKYDESSGFKPITPNTYVEWWGRCQEAIKLHLEADGSLVVNIKEHAEDGQRHTYVKRMLLRMVDDWGWRWVDEYVWIRQGIPGSAESMGRFRNGWESVFWFSVGRPRFYPKNVMHESTGAFSYADQVAAGKTIGAKNQGAGKAKNSPVGHGAGMAYPSNVIDIKHKAETLGHAAAFPVELPAFFIRAHSDEAEIVLEPFCGTGTTMIAAQHLRRRCYGIELSPAYCDVIVTRWEKFTGLKAKLQPQ